MGNFLIVALLLGVVITLYILSYKWNNDTKPPNDDKPLFECASCHAAGSCSVKYDNHASEEACETERKDIALKEFYYKQKESSN
ncbi:MAG: hypothetical protein UMR38_06635 [Candidatus Izemoplasma sp.]|nr:hypothetical protein [Candidatus Izemoplasma sp.]